MAAIDDRQELRIQGVDECVARLRALPLELREKVFASLLRRAMRAVQQAAIAKAPTLAPPKDGRKPNPYRTPGLLKKSIKIRRSRRAEREGDKGVFVNVKPLKPVRQRGAKNPNDPFYWRWVNFGKQGFEGVAFLEEGAKKFPEALRVFEDGLVKTIARVEKGAKL